MAMEAAVRYRLPDPQDFARLSAEPRFMDAMQEGWQTKLFLTSYYDTRLHTLHQMGCSLRLREEGGHTAAAFKAFRTAHGPLFVREVWQTPAANICAGIPALLAQGAPPYLSELFSSGEISEGIANFRVSHHRKNGILMLPGQLVISVSLDMGVIYADEKKEPLSELVLELVCGELDALAAFALNLEADYALPREISGKYERALRLLRSRPAAGAQP